MQTSRNKLSTWISGIHGGQWGKEPVFTCQPDNSSLYNIIYSHAHIWLYKAACHWDSSIYGHIWTPMRRKPEGNRGRKNKQQLCIFYIWCMYVYMQFKSMLLLIWVRSNRTMEYHIHHQKTMEVQRARKVHTIGSWAGCLTPENML